MAARQVFNILAVGQSGRLQYEAVLLAASLRAADPGFPGKLFIAEPQPGPLWRSDPRIPEGPIRSLLTEFDVEFLPFENRDFGEAYPIGNKIEALAALPEAPFLFLDTDTLVTGSFGTVTFDFDRPSASMRREASWPKPELYGPGYGAIWASLYHRFGLDYESSLDLAQPDEYWQRYLYFNAGWFFHRSPGAFYRLFRDYASSIRDKPPREFVGQSLTPWLDQIALPLVIHALRGGRPGPELAGLDGSVTCHWRTLPLLYARESDEVVETLHSLTAPNPIKKVLKESDAFRKLVYQGKGADIRALFDRSDLPRREQVIRNTIKQAGLWVR